MSTKEQTYREAITEVGKILTQLESGELDVDDMSSAVKRAAELLQLCRKKLHVTEEEINEHLKVES
ncbi:MAG: exodeoxyribonuclease VII small subunit [Prevotellaceae bacterium]|jgi:exodeoxyribonuclease VII small subunit|nr:exodeoxyribonuclease VII small subunit [Prevotellaceae bacterium]